MLVALAGLGLAACTTSPGVLGDGDSGGQSGSGDSGTGASGSDDTGSSDTGGQDGSTGSDDESGDTGDGPEEDPSDLQDPDPDFFCPDVDPPALSMIEEGNSAQIVMPGLCGHVAYRSNDMLHVVDPTGTIHDLGASFENGRFAKTGQVLAYSDMDANAKLVNIGDPEGAVDFGPFDRHGVVSTLEREDYAYYWICADATLQYGGVEGLTELATDVDCASVAESSGSPVIAFAGLDRVVRVADLDTAEVTTTSIDAVWAVGTDGQAREREDELRLTHDGTVVTASSVELVTVGGDKGPIRQAFQFRLYDLEQDMLVVDEEGAWSTSESSGNGHTLLATDGSGFWTFSHARAWQPVAAGLRPLIAHRDREHLFALEDIGAGTRVLRIDIDGGDEEVLADVAHIEQFGVTFSPRHTAMTISATSDLCTGSNDRGCFGYAQSIYVWSEADGLTGPRTYRSAQPGVVRDDGLAFINGQLYPEGVTQADVDTTPTPARQTCYWDGGAADQCFAAQSPKKIPTVGLPTELGDRFVDLSTGTGSHVVFLVTPPSTEPDTIVAGYRTNGLRVTYGGRVLAFPFQPTMGVGAPVEIWYGEP